jgi:hypothetical protein
MERVWSVGEQEKGEDVAGAEDKAGGVSSCGADGLG